MKEVQYILRSVTPTSLIVLDELCKGTSIEEGASIAWAVCESLLTKTAFTFAATHFSYLTKLADVYCNVTKYAIPLNVYARLASIYISLPFPRSRNLCMYVYLISN